MVDEVAKSWWQSKTIIGIIVSVVSMALFVFHKNVPVDDLTSSVELVLTAVGSVLGIYGRIKAQKVIA